MTDVMINETIDDSQDCQGVVRLEELDRQLVDRDRSEGLRLTDGGGLLAELTKTIIESAAEGEMDDDLGYGKHDPAGHDGSNSPQRRADQDRAHRRRAGRGRDPARPGRVV